MFRFYSFLSPNGTPEPATLALAQVAVHEWIQSEGDSPILEVLGIGVSPFFYSDGRWLFLHEPMQIIKVPLPRGVVSGRVSLHYAKIRGGTTTESRFSLPDPSSRAAWHAKNGSPLNLFSKDKDLFGPLGSSSLRLPVSKNVFSSAPGSSADLPMLLPRGFLEFLQATDGNLDAIAEKRDDLWVVTLNTPNRNFKSSFEPGTFFEKHILGDSPQLSDGFISLPIRRAS